MRKLFICIFSFLLCDLHAFDPEISNPQKTMIWTVKQLNDLIIPIIDIDDVSIFEALDIVSANLPASHSIEFDYEKVKKVDASMNVSLSVRNISALKYVGLLANSIEVDILISPGRVSFVPR